MERVQTAVIGAGVLGLATARALVQTAGHKEVIILDRAAGIGAETSSRNSEVIHAGIYYPPDSLKARFCVKGKSMMYNFCRERVIAHKRLGKLVVASDAADWPTLERLNQHAHASGVTDCRLISKEEARDLEPLIVCGGALFSPSTGIVDSHDLMVNLLADAEDHGAVLALQSTVENGRIDSDRIKLKVNGTWFACDHVINAGGLWADQIAARLHANHSWTPPRQYYAKGNYFRLMGIRSPFSRLVYPVPDRRGGLGKQDLCSVGDVGLQGYGHERFYAGKYLTATFESRAGVHATLDSQNTVKFGPNVEWLPLDASPDDIDYQVDESLLPVFYDSIRRYWPDLPDDTLVPDYSGVRPKLAHPELGPLDFNDFCIADSTHHGIDGLVHLFGIESPGLTSSMAIAEYVAHLVAKTS